MIAASLAQVGVSYDATFLFHDLVFEVYDDRIVGLVGPNGCGKSTILRLLAGELQPTEGAVSQRADRTFGYLPQEVSLPENSTVFQVVRAGSLELVDVETALAQVEERMGDPSVYEDETLLSETIAEQEDLLEEYARLGGPGIETRSRAVLHALGFSESDLDRPVEILSGGQKKLVGLAMQAVRRPSVLLLDEPDNHLDLRGKMLLEKFLRSYEGGVLLVSHDRYLLDLVADEICELEGGRLTRFPGNYSEYAVEKESLRAQQEHRFADQQKELARLRQSADRLMNWGRTFDNVKFIRRAQAIEKRIERMDRVDAPHVERRMRLQLDGWRGSSKVLEASDVHKSYADNRVLRGVDLLLRHGERVGLVGDNGSGKSVLFRLIRGEEVPCQGGLELGPSIHLAYYAQQHETLDPSRTLVDTLRHGAEVSETRAVQTLLRFAFTYDQTRRLVSDLSGGERSRLQLALITLARANFLLLDEPTNNLDIASAEILEEALSEFDGTVLVISHDRYFLDRVVDRIVDLREGRLSEYAGGYGAYAEAIGILAPPKEGE